QAFQRVRRAVEVALLRTHLLHADDVGALRIRPFDPPAPRGGADPVQVQRDDPYHCADAFLLPVVPKNMADDLRAEFIRFAVDAGVLRFGEFRTKAGRLSPYFFNAGLFCDGASLGRLANFYARTLLEAEREGRVAFDLLFGPAYKGIPLASATAVALSQHGR